MQRKLTAILSADVVGYSAMMEADETGTLERLKANRARIFDPQVAAHDGRVFMARQNFALKALGESILCFTFGQKNDGGLAAVEKALSLDPDLPEAYAIKTIIPCDLGSLDEASALVERALALDRESYEAHRSAARLRFRQHRMEDAVRHYEEASALLETDVTSPAMLITCYEALARRSDAMKASQTVLARATKALAQDQNNGAILAYGAVALLTLGERDRAREWTDRAMLIEPDNMNMRYNFACGLAHVAGDTNSVLEMLRPVFARGDIGFVKHAKADLDSLRDDPRFKTMLATAEARLAAADGASN